MTRKELEKLVMTLQSVDPDDCIFIARRRISYEEADSMASYLEENITDYVNNASYPDEESVIEDVMDIVSDANDDSWMYGDEENEERNEFL